MSRYERVVTHIPRPPGESGGSTTDDFLLVFPLSLASRMATGQFDLVKPAALVVREPTVSLLERIDKAITTPSAQSRIVLTGDSGSGKSAVLLQTVSHCLSAGWVVIYVPKGISAHLQSCKSVIDPLLTEENNN